MTLTARPHARLGTTAVAAALLGLALAACGGGGTAGTATPASAVADPASAVSAPTDPAPDGSGTTDSPGTTDGSGTTDGAAPATADGAPTGCIPAPPVVSAARAYPEVSEVKLDGGCGRISVLTTLPPGGPSGTEAAAICAAVSGVAYVGAIDGVTVNGQDGHELATGAKNNPGCAPA